MADRRDTTGSSPNIEIRARAEPAALSDLRRRTRTFLEQAGGDGPTVDDLELVVSELATNVIEHTSSPTITIAITRTDEEWIVDVADVDDLGILSDISLPPMSSPTGRGLFVVRALVDDVRVVETQHSHAVRCRRRLARSADRDQAGSHRLAGGASP